LGPLPWPELCQRLLVADAASSRAIDAAEKRWFVAKLHNQILISATSESIRALNEEQKGSRVRHLSLLDSPLAPGLLSQCVCLLEGLGQILVILAFLSAQLLDRRQLVLGEIKFALDDIGFAEIFAHLRIGGIERDRL
jgi:hypothetical protein